MKTSDILNKAAEVMMERGHCRDHAVGYDGGICLLHAISLANPKSGLVSQGPAWRYLQAIVGRSPVDWNRLVDLNSALGALHEAALLAKEQGD